MTIHFKSPTELRDEMTEKIARLQSTRTRLESLLAAYDSVKNDMTRGADVKRQVRNFGGVVIIRQRIADIGGRISTLDYYVNAVYWGEEV